MNGVIYQRDLFGQNEDLRERFDFVVSFGVVEHFDDPRVPLRAMRRFLRPGGRLLTTTPNLDPGSLTVRVRRIIGPRILAMHKLMSLDDLRSFHEQAGFKTISCTYEGMGLNLEADVKNFRNKFIQEFFFRAVQATRKLIEVLHLDPPNTRLTGYLMVYVGEA